MEQDVAANPLYIGLLSTIGVVFKTNNIVHLIKQFLGRWLHEVSEYVANPIVQMFTLLEIRKYTGNFCLIIMPIYPNWDLMRKVSGY